MGHGQQEDDGVEEHHMEGHPEAVGSRLYLKRVPYRIYVLCVLLTCPAW